MRPTFQFLLSVSALLAMSVGTTIAQDCPCHGEQAPAPIVQGGGGCEHGCDCDAPSCDMGCACDCACNGECGKSCPLKDLFSNLGDRLGSSRNGDSGNGNGNRGERCAWYRPYTEQSQPDLFYNYYQPNNNGSTAAAFPAPHPTPSLVGHTYYTYQPFYPTEMLYKHHRTYHQHYNNGMGLNRTKVRWSYNPVGDMIRKMHKMTVYR